MSDVDMLTVLRDIRNWTRAAAYSSVKALLQDALPDSKSRAAFQMLDGTKTMEQVRIPCKMSPNSLLALAQRCTSMGLMEVQENKKRIRLFDLADFGMAEGIELEEVKKKNDSQSSQEQTGNLI